jgi:carbonic anhydrase
MSELPELLAANERYAAEFTKGDLPRPPARRVAILTCMDCRLDPTKFLGLRGSVNRRVAYVSSNDEKAVESL